MSISNFTRGAMVFGVISAALVLIPVAPSSSRAAASPSAACTDGLTRVDRTLGGGIPLPPLFSNPTSSPVKFTMRRSSSYFFGGARNIGSVTVPPHMGRTYAGTIPTFLHTPLGVGRIAVEIRSNQTGEQVLSKCEYQLHLSAPPPTTGGLPFRPYLRWIIQVPIHMCAIEGSILAGDSTPGQTVPPGNFLRNLASANRNIWYPQAQVAFSTVTDDAIPVIRDPWPPDGTNGKLGDIEVDDNYYLDIAGDDCQQVWQKIHPGRPGFPVINARKIVGGPLGVANGAPSELYVPGSRFALSGQRGDDLCGSPVKLTPADTADKWLFVYDEENLPPGQGPALDLLAHELGHVLFLGHGNGLDDDRDGGRAGFPGPRRYDEICDPDWLVPPQNVDVAEDVDSPLPCSLMQKWVCSAELRPLQVETARGAAVFLPGAVDGSPRPPVIGSLVSGAP